MSKTEHSDLQQFVEQNRRRQVWKKFVQAMACLVVFCTTYALILPAITMEKNTLCGFDEHQHTQACYTKTEVVQETRLLCNTDVLEVHVHSDDCVDADGNAACGYADFAIHQHNAFCVDGAGNLICSLPEIEAHQHEDACYEQTDTPICGKEEIILHTHIDDCWEVCADEAGTEHRDMICGQPEILEHSHCDGCVQTVETDAPDADTLTCGLEETVGHIHSSETGCYDEEGNLVCQSQESGSHVHSAMCYGTWVLVCGTPEHIHTDDCVPAAMYYCGLEAHTHDDACQDTEGNLTCEATEHTHSEECTVEPEENVDSVKTLVYVGTDFEVLLRYDDSAEIPDGAELTVKELTGEEYQEYLDRTCEAVGNDSARMLVQFSGSGETLEMNSQDAVAISGKIGFARFFDITILVEGEEVEPKDTVEVTISYDDSVEINDGDKAAVHFTNDGNVEVLDVNNGTAEFSLMSLRNTAAVQSLEESDDNRFVFHQDSFSVTGTITLDAEEKDLDGNIDVSWHCGNSTTKTLTIFADFKGEDGGKSITVKVPSGFKIISYSAREDSTSYSGVSKVQIDDEYLDYVVSSELKPASLDGGIVGVTHSGTWDSQAMQGYTGNNSKTEKAVRTYGGDIEYKLTDNALVVELVVSLQIQQELLSHTSKDKTEEMMPIEIITTQGEETHTATISATATSVVQAEIGRSVDIGSTALSNIMLTGDKEGFTEVFPINVSLHNYLSATAQTGSYFEYAEFCLTYPKGVYYEPDTSIFTIFKYSTSDTIKNLVQGDNEVLKDHLTVTWQEDSDGGGSITWKASNAYMLHSYGNQSIGASFRANTDPENGTAYAVGDRIEGFSMSLKSHQRNGKTQDEQSLSFARKIISPDEDKDIRLIAKNFRFRDITADFGTDAYDYVLGGIRVKSEANYLNNTFLFENPNDLKVTALNLMGTNFKDITVVTNTGNVYQWDTWQGTDKNYGTARAGALLRLSEMGGGQDEYIKWCMFTADLEQTEYLSTYLSGAFIYIGQFQDGDNDGNRSGDAVLRLLVNDTTYEKVKEAMESNSLDEITMINGGDNATYTNKPIIVTDRTKIQWIATGVGKVQSTVTNKETGETQDTYYANTQLAFTSLIESGFTLASQDMLINPDLIISLPEGISLDTSSVYAISVAGTSQGEPVQLIQDGTARETVIDGVTWKTFRFKAPEDQPFALVALERHLNTTAYEEQRISASFEAVVDPVCGQHNLSLQDIIMWDVRNTGLAPDTDSSVGDATKSNSGQICARADKNNFLGYGTDYMVANDGDSFLVKPLIGLNVDMAIKPVADKDDASVTSGYITYNGLTSSIAPVIPGKYVDVKLNYLSTSTTEYFKGTVIYVPIPKVGVDYANYFENVNLTDPMLNEGKSEYTKTFGFTMDLTGAVSLGSSENTPWVTLYALKPVSSNTNSHENVAEGVMDTWEPVEQNGATVTWLTADQITDWSQVAMIRFEAQDNVAPNESGDCIMRLYVHDLESEDGPAKGGTYNYWRGYSKAVTKQETLVGNWKYTSVVAATPAMETLEGQIFVDRDRDGLFGNDDLHYTPGSYTVELSRVGGGMETRTLPLDEQGFFKLLGTDGEPEYLTAGTYTVTVRRNNDPNFYFANTGESIGQESAENEWSNNVSGSGAVASWQFTVTNTKTEGEYVHRVGIAVKAVTSAALQGVKTYDGGKLTAGEYSFHLKALDGALVNQTTATNAADGTFSFGIVNYETPGTYCYEITEDCSDPMPGIIYDHHITAVTVTVDEAPDTGILSITVVYDNSTATTDSDRAITDKAAFTNMAGYKLPETGGAGITSYTAGGLLLMMAAMILLYIHNLKHRKEESPSS